MGSLQVSSEQEIVLLLTDKAGHVVWRTAGPVTDSKRAALDSFVISRGPASPHLAKKRIWGNPLLRGTSDSPQWVPSFVYLGAEHLESPMRGKRRPLLPTDYMAGVVPGKIYPAVRPDPFIVAGGFPDIQTADPGSQVVRDVPPADINRDSSTPANNRDAAVRWIGGRQRA